jgi:hypothetical protein
VWHDTARVLKPGGRVAVSDMVLLQPFPPAVAWLFWPFLMRFEATKGLVRGAPGSELSAMIFGEYFPNPALFGTGEAARVLVSPWHAACVEGFGTAVLVLVIFALTSPRNRAAPTANLGPFFIGFTVAVLISLFAPIGDHPTLRRRGHLSRPPLQEIAGRISYASAHGQWTFGASPAWSHLR